MAKKRSVKQKFDFQDGKGPVPAHRHPNGNGWVADSATVDASALIGENALVYGNARVSGRVLVYGDAQVYALKEVERLAQ